LLLAQAVNLRTTQEIVGHSAIAVMATYDAHVAPKLKRDADRKDALFGGQAANMG
jgi:hypothetical protein